jgi:phenylalanyl-tRNA synthetase alpha chain
LLKVEETANFEENDLHALIRELGGDLIEEVKLIDVFHNKKLSKISRCFRINYRSLERTLTNEEIDGIQFQIRDNIVKVLGYELR